MYCGNCGNEVPDGSTFCNHCGARFVQYRQNQPYQQEQPYRQPAQQTPRHSSGTYKASNYADMYAQKQSQTYSGCAIAAFVLGLLAILTSFIPIVNNWSFFVALLGVLLSIVGIALTGKKRRGLGFAIVGLLLSIAAVALVLFTQSLFLEAFNSVTEGAKPVETSQQAEQANSGDSAPAANEKPAESAKDYSKMAIGDSVSLDNGLTVTVVDAQVVPQEYGDDLMRVTVSYVNNGNDSQAYNLLDWKSENANGVERSIEFYMGEDDNTLDSGNLKPGGNITGNVYFESDATKIYYYSNVLLQSESNICWVI